MIISVQSDIWRFREALTELERKQLPFASVLATNRVARLAQQSLSRALPSIFAKKGAPTPFTRRAVGMTRAYKGSVSKGTAAVSASVFIKPIQARYLGIEETGGDVSRAPGKPILTPVDAELNPYGNIPKRMLQYWKNNPRRYFIGEVRGVYGAWERVGSGGPRGGMPHGLKLLVAFRGRARYRPRFGFQDHIAASVRANFLPALSAGMARAMATAIRR